MPVVPLPLAQEQTGDEETRQAKNVSSDSTPPPVKYPACTEIANQIVKPRQPSSAGQCGLRERVAELTLSGHSSPASRRMVSGSVAHQDGHSLSARGGLAHAAEARAVARRAARARRRAVRRPTRAGARRTGCRRRRCRARRRPSACPAPGSSATKSATRRPFGATRCSSRRITTNRDARLPRTTHTAAAPKSATRSHRGSRGATAAARTATSTAGTHGVSLRVSSAVRPGSVRARSTSTRRVQCDARRAHRGDRTRSRSRGKVSARTAETAQSSPTGMNSSLPSDRETTVRTLRIDGPDGVDGAGCASLVHRRVKMLPRRVDPDARARVRGSRTGSRARGRHLLRERAFGGRDGADEERRCAPTR